MYTCLKTYVKFYNIYDFLSPRIPQTPIAQYEPEISKYTTQNPISYLQELFSVIKRDIWESAFPAA